MTRWRVGTADTGRVWLRSEPGGVVLGVDGSGRPATLPAPAGTGRLVACVGSLSLGRHIVFRAVGAGLSASVATGRPAAWSELQGRVGGRGGLPVRGLDELSGAGPAAGPGTPATALLDGGARPSPGTPAPWTVLVVLLPFVHPAALDLLARSDAAVVGRVSPGEADLLADALGLPDRAAAVLPALGDTEVLSVAADTRRVDLAPTAIEQDLLGPLLRVDH